MSGREARSSRWDLTLTSWTCPEHCACIICQTNNNKTGWRQDHWTHKLVAFKCDDPSVHSVFPVFCFLFYLTGMEVHHQLHQPHLGPVWLPTTPSSGTLSLLFDPHRCHRHSCCLLECHTAQRSSYLIGCLFFDLFTFLWIQFSFKHLKSCLVFQPRSHEAMTRKKKSSSNFPRC